LPKWHTIKATIKHLNALTTAGLHSLLRKLMDTPQYSSSNRYKDMEIKANMISMRKMSMGPTTMETIMRRAMTTVNINNQLMAKEGAGVVNIRHRAKDILYNRTIMEAEEVAVGKTREHKIEALAEEVHLMADRLQQVVKGADTIVAVGPLDEAILMVMADLQTVG